MEKEVLVPLNEHPGICPRDFPTSPAHYGTKPGRFETSNPLLSHKVGGE